MTKSLEKIKSNAGTTPAFNSVHDYITFAVLMVFIIGSLSAFYVYNLQAQVFGRWAKEFYDFLLK
ncbi:MAG: hypothetical protein ACD_21C00036G0002 [uncultured bacterium]|nr:MAG: hypothetical protein ACD_21C00036G0002 [uncultured bacterium]